MATSIRLKQSIMGKGNGWNISTKDLDDMVSKGTIRGYEVKGEAFNPEKYDKLQHPPKKAGKAKYNNQKVEWDGIVFDSKKEYKRYRELLLLQKQGIIAALKRQVKYVLQKEGDRPITYILDHEYIEVATGVKVYEDVKSVITAKHPVYIMKKKLMKEVHGIEIKEV